MVLQSLRLLLLLICMLLAEQGNAFNDSRYSYSLSTFDRDGKLGQVERALVCASHGTPIIVYCTPSTIRLCAPYVVDPSILKDGTSRFAQVTSRIVLAHTGLSADGRVLLDAAQRVAMEHEYLYDREISLPTLLQELTLLYQRYTRQPGCRPFGSCLIVGHWPADDQRPMSPQLFRLDPSGHVEPLRPIDLVHGQRLDATDLLEELKRQSNNDNNSEESTTNHSWLEPIHTALSALSKRVDDGPSAKDDWYVQTATLTREGVFVLQRHDPNESSA